MYDISPMVILYSDRRRPLSYFLTGSLSVIGGMFTIAGLFDSAVYSAERNLARKVELGKST
ncbi:MAG: hypothetical protein BJ554DRAFT_5545 [Olpidium bornovanus]|uniref:Endoplasmic reticulum vesicle transporter C-terminal domain-containing protein n=1 Tax=Olpidium bornovanus TaxID=278681 RepID=A0A8H8DKR7_9FUNG|nr:MAG: hypothetical protein BJ554DRAFT_5545 [Olpidium bornovanus]